MKKLLSLALALVLCVCFATSAFAADVPKSTVIDVDTEADNGVGVGGVNTATHDITATVTLGSGIVYSVDITWGVGTFTYTDGRVWDPETLTYSTGTAAWVGEANIVMVENRSNAGITATITGEITAENMGDTAVSFVNEEMNTAFVGSSNGGPGVFNLASADNNPGGAGTAHEGMLHMSLTGTPAANVTAAVIGTLTATITPFTPAA